MIKNLKKIFIEKELLDHPRTRKILEKLPEVPVREIDRYDSIFGMVKKPYLQKRRELNLFVARKKGQLIKEAPPAYGMAGDPHFYFVHAYNCIYECEYCYLQGYFQSPDLVLFLNHEEIIQEMKKVMAANPRKKVWFHAGEFSDSLALSSLTGELETYFNFFKNHSDAILELRTKSDQIKELLKLEPGNNIITSFSLSPVKNLDYRAPSMMKRLDAMEELHGQGFPLAVHLDPIIPLKDFKEQYTTLISELSRRIPLKDIRYFSLGVTRFPEKIHHQVSKNYPDSIIFKEPMLKDKNGIIRSPKPIRFPMMEFIKSLLLEQGAIESSIYLCME